ncbi:hypothetical protein AAG906_019973 [Vitis piasezkii]
MDSQVVTVDQFVAVMASIQEAITSFGQKMDRQQPPLPPSQTAPQDTQMPPPPLLEDAHARMDRLEQRMRQLRLSDGGMVWDDFDGLPVASLPAKFRMPKIEPDETITSFISRWREKIAQIIDRPSERDHISMIMRSSQPQFARHLIGFPHVDFGSLVQALYGIEEGIARGLWPNSSFSNSKRKKPTIGAFHKLVEGGLLTALAPRPPPQPLPPEFRMDLHYAYYQGPRHDTDRCFALRHTIQDLIDQGQVNLGQPSVTTNPLPTHTTHSLPPPTGGIHHMDFVQDDVIHMLSWDDGLLEMIVPNNDYEIVGATLDFSIPDVDVQVLTRSRRIAQVAPPITKPFGGTNSREEVKRENDEILKQL